MQRGKIVERMNLRAQSQPKRLPATGFIRRVRLPAIFLMLLSCVSAHAQEKSEPDQTSTVGPQSAAAISGTITDRSGAAIAAAKIKLTCGTDVEEVLSGSDGQFTFLGLTPGPFQLTISSPGFATQAISGRVLAGETQTVPPIVLALATAATEIRVAPATLDIAQDQLREEEKQRVLGVIPNYYVTYVPNAAPLSSKQKFRLALKSTLDPITFGMVAVVAGVQQAQNNFSGYGQGAEGYAKRYGASYANLATSTFIGGAILPSLFKQDPRYFYKGTGSKQSRVFYAIANSVICKSDKGKWQPNYSGILGGLAAGGISNLYYPASDRNSVALTFENALIGIGEAAATNILQEFVIRKLTPNTAGHGQATP